MSLDLDALSADLHRRYGADAAQEALVSTLDALAKGKTVTAAYARTVAWRCTVRKWYNNRRGERRVLLRQYFGTDLDSDVSLESDPNVRRLVREALSAPATQLDRASAREELRRLPPQVIQRALDLEGP